MSVSSARASRSNHFQLSGRHPNSNARQAATTTSHSRLAFARERPTASANSGTKAQKMSRSGSPRSQIAMARVGDSAATAAACQAATPSPGRASQ